MSLIAMATNRLECGNWDFEDNMYTPVLGVKMTKVDNNLNYYTILVRGKM